MKKSWILFSIISLLIGLLTACSTAVDPSEAYKGETPHEIFEKGRDALKNKNFAEATKRFEALDVQYPFGPETEQAQLYLIYAYYMKEEYALSVAAADRFIRLHPTNPNVDYAYYMRGVSDYYQNLGVLEKLFSLDLSARDTTQVRKAYIDFNELVTRFPNSRYTPSAHQYLIYLRNILANHELAVANYYYNRKAYIAAANRASEVVAHYQGAPAIPDALALMVKSYHQLGLTKMEQDAMTVLRYNYPEMKVKVE